MKMNLFILAAAFIAAIAPGCKTQKSAPAGPTKIVIGDNSSVSLDWPGVYTGTVPCADCEGIITTITLNNDQTYMISTVYKGKSYKVCENSGKFSWDEAGNTIKLGGISDAPNRYLVGENKLIQLDMEGNRITGPLAENYILSKSVHSGSDAGIFGKKWKLIELHGKPVENTAGSGKEYFILLDQKENRISGYAGCNSFFGSCELKEGNRITFSKIGSTMMACPNMATEQELFKVLETVDNFTTDGKSLQLNKARMAPMARFELIGE
ncbi:MAG: copper resistance protein NlpE N-terminal domain-containing protein [Bacteroidales bacterium]|nr:copper resistance protein NlpE N-terminal domain-containing protein [Bacteroidales bacterium]